MAQCWRRAQTVLFHANASTLQWRGVLRPRASLHFGRGLRLLYPRSSSLDSIAKIRQNPHIAKGCPLVACCGSWWRLVAGSRGPPASRKIPQSSTQSIEIRWNQGVTRWDLFQWVKGFLGSPFLRPYLSELTRRNVGEYSEECGRNDGWNHDSGLEVVLVEQARGVRGRRDGEVDSQ